MKQHGYSEHHFTWQGIALTVRYCADWHSDQDADFQIAHLEIASDGGVPLPITDTGYNSQFLHPNQILNDGGAVASAKAWLDEASQSKDWQSIVENQRQGSLF